MTVNYTKLGEFTAYSEQAKSASYRRYALLHNLAGDLFRWKECVDEPLDRARIDRTLDEIAQADEEMRAAVEYANQAALFCGKPKITLSDLVSRKPF
ncbi:hypothetical protein GBN32_00665 [Plesiomonas shigelloides]|uniref:hypothetical protein n=1 Tax=Plesiomonas shigelloides TaxID=703 RepID=UPI001261FDEF|nr:hypothetical protein [Plesiomonas shigelloides]KAB7715521.1 hypothetical protein GBN32_00665 [Plesiomonas shigelloides]